MTSGISISRASNPDISGVATTLLTLIEDEVKRTYNPWFGRANLEGLEARLAIRILSLMRGTKDVTSS